MWSVLTNKHRILAVLSISKCKGGKMHYIFHDIHILHPQGINIEHETDGVSLFMGYNLQILIFWSQSHGSLVQNDFSFFKRALNNLKAWEDVASSRLVCGHLPVFFANKSRWPEESQMERPSARVDAAFGREFFPKKNTRWLVTPTVRFFKREKIIGYL